MHPATALWHEVDGLYVDQPARVLRYLKLATSYVSIFRGTRAFIKGLCMSRIVYGRPNSWLRDIQTLVSVSHRSTSFDPPDVFCVDVGVSRKTLSLRKRVSEMVAVRIDAGSNDAASWQPGKKEEIGANNLRLSPFFI